MALYLAQHGISNPKEIDPERALAPQGVGDTMRIASVARDYGVHIATLWHSGATRARETAEIFHRVTGSDRGMEERQGMGPNDDVRALAETIIDNDIMLVGHMPFMGRLASLLVTGDENRPIFRFQNSGMVCLTREHETGFWIIAWALMPSIG
jgi:phosphohistidine phosphatase